ncbi:MAG TPA: DUF4142 domain-containing protein [Chthoniobacterales bacterium]|nr:DUF4142 domain-containing protein [Chthoniobacterales bacterium]
MKHKFTIIVPAIVALASICFLQPVVGAEEEEATASESPSAETAKSEKKSSETKSSETKTAKEKKSSLSAADKKFVENAAKGGMMEVAMGRMAAQRAHNNDVKQFGSRMVTDHSKANNELKSIAARKGISLPAEPKPHAFSTDANYMAMMVKDHQKDLAEFQNQAKNGSDPDLKRFADKTSKVISAHLSEAQRINKALKRERSNLAR